MPPSFRSTRRGSEYLVKWRDQPYSHATWEKLGEDCGLKGAPKAIQEYDALRRHMDPKKRDKRDKKRRKAKSSPDVRNRNRHIILRMTLYFDIFILANLTL